MDITEKNAPPQKKKSKLFENNRTVCGTFIYLLYCITTHLNKVVLCLLFFVALSEYIYIYLINMCLFYILSLSFFPLFFLFVCGSFAFYLWRRRRRRRRYCMDQSDRVPAVEE